MRHYEKFEAVRDFMIKEAEKNDGLVNVGYKEVSEKVGIGNLSTTRNMLIRLIENGELIVEQAPKRGTRNALYRISNDIKKSSDSNISSEFIQIQFEEATVVLRKTQIGICIDKDTLAMCTLESPALVDSIIKANKPIFENNMIFLEDKWWMNRFSTLQFLMKVNIQSCLEIKRKTLVNFQTQVIQNMCATIGNANVITEGSKVAVRSNIQDLCELSKDEVIEMFNQVEIEFNKIFGTIVNEKIQVEKKLNRTTTLLESEKHKKEMYMSEVVALKSNLMERTSN